MLVRSELTGVEQWGECGSGTHTHTLWVVCHRSSSGRRVCPWACNCRPWRTLQWSYSLSISEACGCWSFLDLSTSMKRSFSRPSASARLSAFTFWWAMGIFCLLRPASWKQRPQEDRVRVVDLKLKKKKSFKKHNSFHKCSLDQGTNHHRNWRPRWRYWSLWFNVKNVLNSAWKYKKINMSFYCFTYSLMKLQT